MNRDLFIGGNAVLKIPQNRIVVGYIQFLWISRCLDILRSVVQFQKRYPRPLSLFFQDKNQCRTRPRGVQ